MIERAVTDEAVFEDIPMTGRDGRRLAYRYGYRDLAEFVQALPARCQAIDVGAGKATIGMEVCRQRPDVRWVNADIGYRKNDVYRAVSREASPNLSFEAVNALELTEHFGDERFDRAFSYFMLPHIIRKAGEEAAVIAAEQILRITALDGRASIGPIADDNPGLNGILLQRRFETVTLVPAADSQAVHQQALAIVASSSRL